MAEKMCRAYEIEIEITDDEAENLKRFDAAWQKVRQDCFGLVLLKLNSDEAAAEYPSKTSAFASDQK